MKTTVKTSLLLTASAAILLTQACKKDETTPDNNTGSTTSTTSGNSYNVPATYNFANVDYSDQSTRLSMLAEINAETDKGKTQVLDASKLKNMFSNTASPFTNASLNTSGLKLKDQTTIEAQLVIESLIDSIAKASNSYNTTFGNGVAGVGVVAETGKSYLFAANGFEYRQVIAKTFFASCLLNQIKNNYLSASGIGNSVNNTTVVSGKGTAMEHNWDLAFGTYGVPKDFPTNTAGLLFLGGYSNETDAALKSNTTLMNAFLKGRAAISNKDMSTKDAQAQLIISFLEKMIGAAAILELKEAKAEINGDIALRNHVASEGFGFILGLKFLPGVKITAAQVDSLLAGFGTNLNVITEAQIDAIIAGIASIYGISVAEINAL